MENLGENFGHAWLWLKLVFVPAFWHLWYPHIIVWAGGIVYFAAHLGKPKPRLWFDIGWRLLVSVSGVRIIVEGILADGTEYYFGLLRFPWWMVFLWTAGLMLFLYGEGLHWGGNFFNDHVITFVEQSGKTVPVLIKEKAAWLDNKAGHLWPTLGLFAFAIAQVYAVIIWIP